MKYKFVLTLSLICVSVSVCMAQDMVITNKQDTITGTIVEHTLKTVSIRSAADNKKRNFRANQIVGFSVGRSQFSSKETSSKNQLLLLNYTGRGTSYYSSWGVNNIRVEIKNYPTFRAYLITIGVGGTARNGAPATFPSYMYLFENKELGLRPVLGEEGYVNLQLFFQGTLLFQDIVLTSGNYGRKFVDNLLEKHAFGTGTN